MAHEFLHSAFPRSRGAALRPFLAMDVMEEALALEAGGRAVFHLEVGQPATPAPRAVRARAKAALDENALGYTGAKGLLSLRTRIAQHYRESSGVSIDPDAIFLTSGASGAFVLALLALLEEGAGVASAVPGYPCYQNILEALGFAHVPLPVGAASRFQPTAELLDGLEPAPRALILASPANPTGTLIEPRQLDRLLAVARERKIAVLSDEIYHGLTYGGARARSLAGTSGVFVINSFSKYYSMTGYRLGWLVVPEWSIRAVESLAQALYICAPTLSQLAALAAFDCGTELEEHRTRYERNRGVVLGALTRAGVSLVAPPDGAFYIYANLSAFAADTREFCRRLLMEEGVALTSGVDFDPQGGLTWVRICYAGRPEDIDEAAARIERFLRRVRETNAP